MADSIADSIYKTDEENLIKFWSEFSDLQLKQSFDDKEYIHPKDKKIIDTLQKIECKNIDLYLNKYSNDMKNNYSNDTQYDSYIHSKLLPSPYCGDLRNAKVFILFLNPGFEESNYIDENNNDVIEAVKGTVAQNFENKIFDSYKQFSFNPLFSNTDGAHWIRKKFDGIIKKFSQETDKDYIEARKIFANNIAMLELFPYHSRTFNLNKTTLNELDSCKLMREYVKSLMLRAANNEILLICTRSAKLWGLTESHDFKSVNEKSDEEFKQWVKDKGFEQWLEKNKNLIVYPPSYSRSASLSPASVGGRAIVYFLKKTI